MPGLKAPGAARLGFTLPYLAGKLALSPPATPTGTARYVSATATAGAGTVGDPWTLAFALAGAGGAILPGDTVYLRGGVYRATNGWTVDLAGTLAAPITFRAYPGEHVELNGAIPEFAVAGNTAWELVGAASAGHNVYRSLTSFPVNFFSGGFIQISGEWYSLAGHLHDIAYIQSDQHEWEQTLPRYLGPGILQDPATGKLWVRLDNSTSAAQMGRAVTQISDPDPRNHDLRIGQGDKFALTLTGACAYLRFVNIEVNDFYGMCLYTGAVTAPNGITFQRMTGRTTQFVGRFGGGTNILIDQCTFYAHMPSHKWWVGWHDVKSGNTVADHCRKNALELATASYVEVRNSQFHEFFDGILSNATHHVDIHHSAFVHTWDDGWQMNALPYNINIHHNVFLGAGPSHDQAGSAVASPEPGSVWIHHNVIDVTKRYVFFGRKGRGDLEGMYQAIPFSTHGATPVNGYTQPWKLYYNTLVTEIGPLAAGKIGFGIFGNDAANSQAQHEVYNNIWLVPDGRQGDSNVYSASGREIYDGNVYWEWKVGSPSTNQSIFRFITTSTGTLNGDGGFSYGTPAALRATQVLADSQVYYAPGWEASGLAVNPALDADYKPTTLAVKSGAVNLTGKGWPGTETYEPHRGALAP